MSYLKKLTDQLPQATNDVAAQIKKILDDLSETSPTLGKLAKIFGGCSILFITTQIVRRVFYTLYFKYNKYPPGPIGLPIFGVLFSRFGYVFGANPRNFQNFPTSIGYKYYPVAMYPNGPWSYGVMISDKRLIDRYAKMDAFMDRPSDWTEMMPDGHAVAFSALNGKEMIERRKLFQTTIIKMTDSKYFTEYIQNNIKQKIVFPVIDKAITNDGGKWYPWDTIFSFGFNTIYGASFGPENVLDPQDDDYLEFKKMNEKLFQGLQYFFMMGLLAPGFMKKMAKSEASKKSQDKLKGILMKWMEDRDKSNKNSYIDMMLNSNLDENKAISDIMGTFQAGVHTTSSSIVNQLFILAKYPQIQEKIYLQLRDLCNNADDLEMRNSQDFKNLNAKATFLRAFIEESWKQIMGMGNPRILQQDVKMDFINKNGENDHYILPKGATIEFNGPYFVRNKEFGWKNVNEFDINNYLDDEGKKFKNPVNGLDVFGYGKRDCPGKALARKENFFAIAILVYNYRFCGPKGDGDTDFETPFFGIKSRFPLTVIKRK